MLGIRICSVPEDELVATYLLPAQALGWTEFLVHARTSKCSFLTSDSFTPLQTPFASSPDPKLWLLHIEFICPEFQVTSKFNFIIQMKCFFPDPESLSQWPDKIVPWNGWGIKHTRVFKGDMQFNLHSYRISTEDAILDFNPLSIARDICRGHKEGIFTQPDVISDEVFREPFEVALLYRRVFHHIQEPNLFPPRHRFWYLEDSLLCANGDGVVEVFQ
jgi:hypothetical protein